MTITFENDNDVIVYALKKVIAYARRTQQIFVVQCVWWLASVVELEQELIAQIDNSRKQSEALLAKDRELSTGLVTSIQERRQPSPVAISRQARGISTVPRDIQEESRTVGETRYIHPDRVSQVQDPNNDISESRHIHPDRVSQVQDTYIDVSDLDLDSSGDERQLRVVQHTEQFIRKSRKERKKLGSQKQADLLCKTRSGKIPAKPLSKKQRQYLQSIAKPTIAEYLKNRK